MILGSNPPCWIPVVGDFFFRAQMPIQSVLLKRFNHWNELLSESRSQRTSVMSEILQGIRAIKFNAWMRPFQKRVEEARAPEFRLLKKTTMLVAAIIALFDFSPVVISVATFVWYSLTTDVLVASTIFPALTLIQVDAPKKRKCTLVGETFFPSVP